MPNIVVGNRLLMTIKGTYFGQRTMNTFLYRCAATASGVSDVVAIDALHAKLSAANDLFQKYSACLPGDGVWTGGEVWYQIIAPVRYRRVDRPFPFGPLDVYTSVTANVSASIERFSDFAGRKGIGGIRVPIGTSGCSDGLIGDALRIDLQALADKLNDIQGTATPAVSWVPQVGLPGHKKLPVPTPGDPMQSLDCAGAVVKGEARIVRRRTVGLGI